MNKSRHEIIVLCICYILIVEKCASILPIRPHNNPYALCIRVPSYLRRHTKVCTKNYQLMAVIFNGTYMATRECKRQFQMRPWNCSSSRESLPRIILHAFPETGFLYAIQSAGVAYSIAHACSKGMLENCRCPRKMKHRNYFTKDTLHRIDTSCLDRSITYGMKQSRRLLRNNREHDTRFLLDEHNKEAGRLALISQGVERNLACQCRGVSGACSIKICTKPLPSFRQIGSYLMMKYESAVPVTSDNNGVKLIPAKETVVSPTRFDIVYAENSPEFCKRDLQLGSLGTSSRVCLKDSNGPAGCKVMCCNRGYKTLIRKVKEPCRCVMEYCCKVQCEECEKEIRTYVCN